MSITARFATYTGNPKKVKKALTFGAPVTISAHGAVDDLTCDFVVNGAALFDANYMQVDWNGTTKNYFIEQRIGQTGTMTRIRCTCDVLKTYQTAVLSAPAVIRRTSDTRYVDTFLRDGFVTTRANTEIDAAVIAPDIIADTEYIYVGILQKVPSKGAL